MSSLPCYLPHRVFLPSKIAPILRGIFSRICNEFDSNLATFNSSRLATKSRGESFLVLHLLSSYLFRTTRRLIYNLLIAPLVGGISRNIYAYSDSSLSRVNCRGSVRGRFPCVIGYRVLYFKDHQAIERCNHRYHPFFVRMFVRIHDVLCYCLNVVSLDNSWWKSLVQSIIGITFCFAFNANTLLPSLSLSHVVLSLSFKFFSLLP